MFGTKNMPYTLIMKNLNIVKFCYHIDPKKMVYEYEWQASLIDSEIF